jgi:O-antigen ligase
MQIVSLFICCVFFLFAGSRFSDGGMATGVFRSLHAIDLLFPFLIYLCLRNWAVIRQSLPTTTIALSAVWLAYVVTFAHLGHFISGLAFESNALVVSLLFATKELEFFVMMCFGALAAAKAPRMVRRVLWTALIALALWIPFDMQAPSGYYMLGLPYEKGAIQVGLVYGMTALFAGALLLSEAPQNFSRRFSKFIVVLALVAGMLLSLSRTAVLGFGASIGLLLLLSSLRTVLSVFIFLIITILLWLTLAPEIILYTFNVVFGRWGDVSEHAGYRSDKWLELLIYLADRPELLFFGAGFDSPNQLVLGPELGHILAVDNGYVRRLFEIGVVGTVLYFLLLSSIFFSLLKERNTRAGVTILIFFLASGITAETMQISQSAGLYFLLTGVIFGLSKRKASALKDSVRLQKSLNIPS